MTRLQRRYSLYRRQAKKKPRWGPGLCENQCWGRTWRGLTQREQSVVGGRVPEGHKKKPRRDRVERYTSSPQARATQKPLLFPVRRSPWKSGMTSGGFHHPKQSRFRRRDGGNTATETRMQNKPATSSKVPRSRERKGAGRSRRPLLRLHLLGKKKARTRR